MKIEINAFEPAIQVVIFNKIIANQRPKLFIFEAVGEKFLIQVYDIKIFKIAV